MISETETNHLKILLAENERLQKDNACKDRIIKSLKNKNGDYLAMIQKHERKAVKITPANEVEKNHKKIHDFIQEKFKTQRIVRIEDILYKYTLKQLRDFDNLEEEIVSSAPSDSDMNNPDFGYNNTVVNVNGRAVFYYCK